MAVQHKTVLELSMLYKKCNIAHLLELLRQLLLPDFVSNVELLFSLALILAVAGFALLQLFRVIVFCFGFVSPSKNTS
jgi:hypothetical protein